jgi:cytochrome c biogenesis protein CcmG/thiol:disulfide interchange protein DsbE
MVQLANDFRDRGLEVIGVVYGESPARAIGWMNERGGVRYTWLSADRGSALARDYGVWGIPHMFLIDPEGRVVMSCLGCTFGTWSLPNLRTFLDGVL